MLIKYYHRYEVPLATLKMNASFQNEFWSIKTLKIVAYQQGVLLVPYYSTFEELKGLIIKSPVILYIKNEAQESHFVVVYQKKQQRFLIADPSKEKLQWIDFEQLRQLYLGVVITSCKTMLAKQEPKNRKNFLFSLLKPYVWTIVGLVFTNLVLTFFSMLLHLMMKVFIDSHHSFILQNVWLRIFLAFSIIILSKIGFSFVQSKVLLLFATHFNYQLTMRYYFAISESELRVIEQFQEGDWLQRNEDLGMVCYLLTIKFLQTFNSLVITIVSIVLLCFIHWWLLVFALSIAFVLVLINLLFYHYCFHYQMQEKKQSVDHCQNYLQLIKTTISRLSFDHQDFVFNKLKKSYQQWQETNIKLSSINLSISHYQQLIINFYSLLILYFSSQLLANNTITLGQIIFASTLSTYISTFFQEQGEILNSRKKIIQAINRIKPFLFFTKKVNRKMVILDAIKTISLKNLSFKYQDINVITALNYDFTQTTFLKGESGAGKSTILKIIAQLYQNYEGDILCNNINLQLLGSEEIICYLSQSPDIYEGNVLDNIINFNYCFKNLEKINTLNINELLLKANLKLTGICQIDGRNLSSGQKQLIRFLSLFFSKNWQIILIDEACSNIDYELKIELIKMLTSYFNSALIIFVSHDNSLARYFTFKTEITNKGILPYEINY